MHQTPNQTPDRDEATGASAPRVQATERAAAQAAVGAVPPDHPDAALFARVRALLPAEISDEQAARVMLQAKVDAGIQRPEELQKIVVERNHAFVGATTPGYRTAVDLTQPAPSVQESLDRSVQYTQQQQREIQQPAHRQSL